MIARITIELLPDDQEEHKKRLGTMIIANDNTGNDRMSNYTVTLSKGEDPARIWKSGKVRNFPRQGHGIYELMLAALRPLIEAPADELTDQDSRPFQARAKTVVELVSPRQLRMIRSLGREAGCDVDQESFTIFQVPLEEISIRAAARFIDHLKRLMAEKKGSNNE